MKKSNFTENMQPTRFLSLGSTVPSPTTWAQIVEEIQNGTHAVQTEAYRDAFLRQEAAESAGNAEEAQRMKQQKMRIKKA